jgi:hypothetical protein
VRDDAELEGMVNDGEEDEVVKRDKRMGTASFIGGWPIPAQNKRGGWQQT